MPSTENKPVIAVDIDDVIYPLVPSLIDYLDIEHKEKLTENDFIEYDLRKVWGGGPEEAAEIFDQYKLKTGTQIAPIKGAKEALEALADQYEIIVMTSRDTSGWNRTSSWLTHHFPELFKDVHLLGNKQDSETYRPKAEVCKELGVYCLIDDNLKHILSTHELGIKTILFGNYSWNQIAKLPHGIIRVDNWPAVLKVLL